MLCFSLRSLAFSSKATKSSSLCALVSVLTYPRQKRFSGEALRSLLVTVATTDLNIFQVARLLDVRGIVK